LLVTKEKKFRALSFERYEKGEKGGGSPSLTIRKLRCCNLNLGLVTKARACKVASQERKLGSERKCEGTNPHTPKGASTLGVGVSVDFHMFRRRLQGPKPNGLRIFLYH
jgi:hypothetical protein